MKRKLWLATGLGLLIAVGLLTAVVFAASDEGSDSGGGRTGLGANVSLYAAPPAGTGVAPRSLDGSSVEESTGFACYDAGTTQTLCFTVYNGSPDVEWIEEVWLTFPTLQGDWAASCLPGGQDPYDSTGSPVNFNCVEPAGNAVRYEDGDTDGWGEITNGSSWSTCVEVTIPSGYTGPRFVAWHLDGDGGSTLDGDTELIPCTPLMLAPDQVEVEGCNGLAQTIDLRLWNHSAGNDITVDFSYPSHSPGVTPLAIPSMQLSTGGVLSFTAQFKPDRCLAAGDVVTATLRAEGGGASAETLITQTITAFSGWQRQENAPARATDNVVIWAAQDDGRLWSIGGFGAAGATHSYDPPTGEWLTHTTEISPYIDYPSDGCYGLNASGDEVVVLFPDTLTTDTLHIYNITHDSWSAAPVPGFFPAEGRWAQDVVSLQSLPSQVMKATEPNACYLSGGADRPGGGTTRNLWVYYPDGTPGSYLGDFYDSATVFDFHASWYVPWIGEQGAICVAGGVDHNSQIIADTQCYDIAAGQFRGVNADLGPLPEPWWGMADGWQLHYGEYQIWLAGGVSQNGVLLPASAYASEGTSFTYGPGIPTNRYRMEGSGWQGSFYVLEGAYAGLAGTKTNLLLAQCPWCVEISLPLVLQSFP